MLDQFEGSFDADVESFQVAIVDADDAGVGGEGAVEFRAGVNFHERLHSELAAERDQFAKRVVRERCDDEQEAVGVVGARFPDLPGIEDEVLAQRRGALLALRASRRFFSEPPKNSPSVRTESAAAPAASRDLASRGSVKGIANNSARGRGGLQFGDNIDGIARESERKIADGSCSVYTIFKGGFREDAFAMVDLGAAGLEDAVEDGAGVGVGVHGGELVC